MADQSGKLRAALIGIGHDHAWGKVQALRRSADMELVGAFEPDASEWGRQQAQDRFTDVAAMSEIDVLHDETIRVVFIETLPRHNLRWARRALEHGKHIHIDKAPSPSLADLRAVLDLAATRNLHVQMGYQFRYNPAITLALRAMREGWLGNVNRINVDIPTHIGGYAGVRAKDGAHAGALFYLLGCHVLDAAMLFLGKPSSVWASHRRDARDHGEPFEDNCTAVLEYSGAVTLLQTWITGNDPMQHRRFQVIGGRGSVLIEPIEPPGVRLFLSEPHEDFPAGWSEPTIPMRPRYDGDIEDLAAWIRGERTPAYTAAHDLAVHETLLRICGLIGR